jgi:4-amino-4-deoxy-L-arabinose transferase-like glycosyltransferase
VRQLIRANLQFFVAFTAAAFVLRLTFIHFLPAVVTDSFTYGDIAKNWLQHGIYGLSGPQEISPTYIRLPGYPAFLAFIFAIFGVEHYRAVLIAQMFVDVGTSFLCADIALRLFGPRVSKLAFALAALSPFLANYAAAALSETLEVFFTALALDFALRGLQECSLGYWAGCGAACAGAILLRPDGVLLLISIALYVVWHFARARQSLLNAASTILLLVLIAALPLVPWTARNWHVFHKFQPLAPRYANEPDEFVPMGFNHWTKTWIADYASVEEIYWEVPGSEVDVEKLPSRAFDKPQQRKDTAELITDYNRLLHVSPELDKRFEAIASDRTRENPLRQYVWLPILRIVDMWLRPRTELLPSDSRWWEFDDELKGSIVAVTFGATNLLYILFALVGWMRARHTQLLGLLTLFVVLRSAFLGTLENPEPRYTLEMYPAVIVLAATAIVWSKPWKEA